MQNGLAKWRSNVPKDSVQRRKAKTLGVAQLSSFFQEASRLASSDPETMKEVVTSLTGRGGEIRLSELLDQTVDQLHHSFRHQVLPFLEVLSHPNSLASSRRATLFDCFYGVDGQRATRALRATIRYMRGHGENHPDHLEAPLIVFSDLVVLKGFHVCSAAFTRAIGELLELTRQDTMSDLADEQAQRLRLSLETSDGEDDIGGHSKQAHTRGSSPGNAAEMNAKEMRFPDPAALDDPKAQQGWSIHPDLHDDVKYRLEEVNLSSEFYEIDDPVGSLEERDTHITGRFKCHNKSCKVKGWSSNMVAVTIRYYEGDRYNARVYHQRYVRCRTVEKPFLDESYSDRVVHWIKRWRGLKVDLSPPSRASKGPHREDLCEGCRNGRCAIE